MLASCCGPLLAIGLFQTMGDDWDLYHLQVVMYVGLSLEFCNALLMLLFDDSKALDENTNTTTEDDEDAVHVNNNAREDQEHPSTEPQPEATSTITTTTSLEDDNNLREPLLANPADDADANNIITTTATTASSDQDSLKRRQRRIPYILFFSSLVMAMGSGMTIKFFPLFFKDQVGFSPTQVQGIYVLAPLTMALFSSVATSMARWFGRVQTVLLLSTSGVACLVAMVFGFDHYFHQHKYQLVVMYLLRTAFMNCTYPLFGSILMDFVPKQERARWKSLESISQFGWCGSAALGGYISDRWSYNHTFGLTALLQGIGVVLFAFLLPLVPRREQDLAVTNNNHRNTIPNADDAIHETNGGGEPNEGASCCAAAAAKSSSNDPIENGASNNHEVS
jgi:hypothetical protein